MWAEWIQASVVTMVAGAALVSILRPYFARRRDQAPACANCPSAPVRRRNTSPAPAVHKLHLVSPEQRQGH